MVRNDVGEFDKIEATTIIRFVFSVDVLYAVSRRIIVFKLLEMLMYKRLCFLILPIFLLSCGTKTDTAQTAAETKPTFTVFPFSIDKIPTGLSYPGEAKHGLHWKDKLGESWLILSEQRTTSMVEDGEASNTLLYAHLYRASAQGGWTLVRKVQDAEKGCVEGDNVAGFIEQAATVSDEDGDQVGEAMFMYKLGCRSDVSPVPLKLILLIDDEKYALRGNTLVSYDGVREGGNPPQFDPAFSALPEKVRTRVLEQYKKFME